MGQRLNARAGETGYPQETPPTRVIVRNDSHTRESGGNPAIAQIIQQGIRLPVRVREEEYDMAVITWGRGGRAVSPLASHQEEPGSIPGRATGLSYVGIVSENAAGRWVFSGTFRFLRPFIPVLLHTHLNNPHRFSRPRCSETLFKKCVINEIIHLAFCFVLYIEGPGTHLEVLRNIEQGKEWLITRTPGAHALASNVSGRRSPISAWEASQQPRKYGTFRGTPCAASVNGVKVLLSKLPAASCCLFLDSMPLVPAPCVLMRVKLGEYEASPECYGGGNGEIPDKTQRRRPTRFPRTKTGSCLAGNRTRFAFVRGERSKREFIASQDKTPYAYKDGKSCKETCITAERDWAAMACDWGHDYLPKRDWESLTPVIPSPETSTPAPSTPHFLTPALSFYKHSSHWYESQANNGQGHMLPLIYYQMQPGVHLCWTAHHEDEMKQLRNDANSESTVWYVHGTMSVRLQLTTCPAVAPQAPSRGRRHWRVGEAPLMRETRDDNNQACRVMRIVGETPKTLLFVIDGHRESTIIELKTSGGSWCFMPGVVLKRSGGSTMRYLPHLRATNATSPEPVYLSLSCQPRRSMRSSPSPRRQARLGGGNYHPGFFVGALSCRQTPAGANRPSDGATSRQNHIADLPCRSRLVRRRSVMREVLGSNPRYVMGLPAPDLRRIGFLRLSEEYSGLLTSFTQRDSGDRIRAVREVTSQREICDCEYQAVKSAAGRLDYWIRWVAGKRIGRVDRRGAVKCKRVRRANSSHVTAFPEEGGPGGVRGRQLSV
ncbi:hypothetical protein PR048_014989 [Dryococelus australis]|uniref:Uncharacterized protein n=1 Tax=Dryococelus australis TaxID=614101 RepID=A0ABQ9HFV2_9NEOP|nr:hypothetical protein PR048_014989 [Dryococelus australis]